jgi:tellurite resistance protein TerC
MASVPAVTLETSAWHWALFALFVLVALAFDLGVFHRKGRSVVLREALMWTIIWAASAVTFALWVAPNWIQGWGSTQSATFLTGYVVELCLSMDNVFVIAVLFRFFQVPPAWQHRVLFWGIVGALLMRGLMIAIGAAVITRWSWLLYGMGLFLVWTGVRMLLGFGSESGVAPEQNWVLRIARKNLPISSDFDGERLTTRKSGKWMMTPLALVLIVVETTDVAFALDSIPAIFGITRDPFIVFTSNIFAVLGLRSLYFVLASIMDYFRFLKSGLALVLVVIGLKMVLRVPLEHWFGEQLMMGSLLLVLGILAVSILGSVVWKKVGGSASRPDVP